MWALHPIGGQRATPHPSPLHCVEREGFFTGKDEGPLSFPLCSFIRVRQWYKFVLVGMVWGTFLHNETS
jgi:hypothetical protein